MRLVHLTDPHMSTLDGEKLLSLRGKRWSGYLSWRKNRRNHFLPAVLNNLVKAVRAENADQILLTGDLVHIGLGSEITQAAEWLTTLGPGGKVMLVPGNHDIYSKGSEEAVLQSWSDYLFQPADGAEPEQPAGQFPVVRKLGKLSLIGVTTGCVTPVFMATGKLGNEQLQRLTELLQQAASEGQVVVLLIHHPPLPGMTNWRKALVDSVALETVLKQYPPSLIFYGHMHYNRDQQWGDSRIYCTASASSVSDASYRVIDIDEGDNYLNFRMSLKSLSIEAGASPGFVTIDEQRWQVPKLMS
ncbi:MAG: metallophosphoesterase [Xanthomonadales bacterium]|nr:metallophosphoesterase [Xanthomonadales bacterium]